VILDLIQYENVVVKRALNSNAALLEKLGIASVPSAYLIYPNGSHGLANMSKLYMADLESGLHHLLRVELATHKTLEGAELRTFKDFVTVLAKLFPGRQAVAKLLETLQVWLVSLPLEKIPYDAVLDLLNNRMRISGLFLPSRVQWRGCRGSRPELRGYTCAFWELFHVLTVQAAAQPGALQGTGLGDDPGAVLQVMRSYVRDFFGCRACAQHFEEMARESLDRVKTPDEAVLWLWEKHNVVNARLAGDLSEDPRFPKVQWPPPGACPACHEESRGLHAWNEAQVLQFLKQHYGRGNVLQSPAEDQGGSEERERPGEGGAPSAKKQQSGRPEDKLLAPPPRAKGSPGGEQPGPRAGVEEEEAERRRAVSFLGGGFSSLDMSLCIVLYVASSLFLMIMYFFFRVRSKRWKMRPPRPYV
ncbi:hypothetical protein lerEdw1_014688, partial [Lerista edwardsae]